MRGDDGNTISLHRHIRDKTRGPGTIHYNAASHHQIEHSAFQRSECRGEEETIFSPSFTW